MKTNKKILINKYKKILLRYQNKKKTNIHDMSIELPENHFYNKMAFETKFNFSKIRTKKSDTTQRQINTKQHSSHQEHFYETISKRKTLKTVPSNLKVMPLIPFWRTSFDIIDPSCNYGNQTLLSTSSSQQSHPEPQPHPQQSLYVTMRPRTDREPIYV